MDIFYQVLDYINIVFIAFTLISTAIQVIYMILAFFCKKVTFAESEIKNKICVLLPARNEEGVIGKLITDLQNQTYPKDKYDIIVIAHNCTDKTKDVALTYGAKVFECNTAEKLKGMALKLAVDKYINDDYDLFVVLDADCRVENDYLSKMNDAYASGVHIARSYLGSSNTFDNSVACASSLYTIRDGRVTARVREKLKMNVQLIGASFFMSKQLLQDLGGFPSDKSLAEDADFMVKVMLKKYTIHYVEDAICYTENTTTLSEVFKRNRRIGKGVNKVFWKDGYKLIGKFFTTFKITYLDIFFTLAFLPISMISCTWFPVYYIFLILKMLITGQPVLHMAVQMDLMSFIPMAIIVIIMMVAMMSLQSVEAIFLQRDRMLKNNKWREYTKGILMTCPLMLWTNVAISCGILTPAQKWNAVKRTNVDDINSVIDNNSDTKNTNDTQKTEEVEILEIATVEDTNTANTVE